MNKGCDLKKIVVTSVAFSKNEFLIKKIKNLFPNTTLNVDAKRFNEDELIQYLKDADGIIVGLDKIDHSILVNLPKIKIVAKFGVGLDNINLEDCAEQNVSVGWTGGVNKTSVAEMTLGFMLMFSRNLYTTSNQLKAGEWNKSGGFQLSGKTIGIIGLGHIGKELVRLIKPFGCTILVNDIIEQDDFCKSNNLFQSTKKTIYKECDIITIHTPLSDETLNMITLDELKLMKKSAYLINTARGKIINEIDLKYALQDKIIAGAALDVYEKEPPTDRDFLSLPNLICTPHIGGNAKEAVESMGMSAIRHLENYFKE